VREPPELRELVGNDIPPEELEQIRQVDSLLRRVPAPPHEVPPSLTAAVTNVALGARPHSRRRFAVAVAFAALLAALSFGIGRWAAGEDFEADWTVAMVPTENANAGAAASLAVGERDEASGNRELVLDVSGLPTLEQDEFYALWLEKDGEWEATCGYFSVGEGETTIRMTVSYDFADFDAWAISTGHPPEHPPPVLVAQIPEV
jgi:Anti-sigma-K factor rskA